MFRAILSATRKAARAATGLVVDQFVPGIGMVKTPIEQVSEPGSVSAGLTGYRTIKEIRQMARTRVRAKAVKPFFYLSKSKVFKKRVGRIIYGKEGEDVFL